MGSLQVLLLCVAVCYLSFDSVSAQPANPTMMAYRFRSNGEKKDLKEAIDEIVKTIRASKTPRETAEKAINAVMDWYKGIDPNFAKHVDQRIEEAVDLLKSIHKGLAAEVENEINSIVKWYREIDPDFQKHVEEGIQKVLDFIG